MTGYKRPKKDNYTMAVDPDDHVITVAAYLAAVVRRLHRRRRLRRDRARRPGRTSSAGQARLARLGSPF
jgi:hypothetical protein